MKTSAFITVPLILMPGLSQAQEQADKLQKNLPHTSPEQVIKLVLGLLFVLAMIFVLAWLFRKYIGGGVINNAGLKAIAGVSVGQKERVVLIQVGERQLLVGVAPGQVNMLHAIERGEEIKPPREPQKGAFAEKLRQSLKGMEKQ